ncbi:MAG: hypothetical protein ACXVCE_14855 [Bacteriovorax sp.]
MKSLFFLVFVSYNSLIFAAGSPVDDFLGCYKTTSLFGEKPGNEIKPISRITYFENKDGKTTIDPITNKPIPYYKVDINSGRLIGKKDPWYYWTMAFPDRGTWSNDSNNVYYTYEGQIKVLPDDTLPGTTFLMKFLFNLHIQKISDTLIEVTTEVVDIGNGSDCREYSDCNSLYSKATLTKISCK